MRAMILAAGRGQRMRPLTDSKPKPLLQAGGKPLIIWHLLRLAQAGFKDVIINHAWLGEQIVAALGDGSSFGLRLRYSAENPALETAGGIAKALDFFADQPFLVINGDIWSDWNPSAAHDIAANLHSGSLAHLIMVKNPAHHRTGDFVLQADGRLNLLGSDQNKYTFAGIGVYRPQLFAAINIGTAEPLAPLLRQAITDQRLHGSLYQGRWVDVGTSERLAQLDSFLHKRNCLSTPVT